MCYNLHRAGTQTDILALEPVHTEPLQGAGENQNSLLNHTVESCRSFYLNDQKTAVNRIYTDWLTLDMHLYMKLLLVFDRPKSLQLI